MVMFVPSSLHVSKPTLMYSTIENYFLLCACDAAKRKRPDSHVMCEFMSSGLEKHQTMQNAFV